MFEVGRWLAPLPVARTPSWHVVAPVEFGLVVFRYQPQGMSDADAEKAMKVFGMDMTGRSFAFFMARPERFGGYMDGNRRIVEVDCRIRLALAGKASPQPGEACQ